MIGCNGVGCPQVNSHTQNDTHHGISTRGYWLITVSSYGDRFPPFRSMWLEACWTWTLRVGASWAVSM
ncbi:hypothetical protein BJX65DRAFT_266524 [Aspergillus insuetus]